jgi:hypothetical protein
MQQVMYAHGTTVSDCFGKIGGEIYDANNSSPRVLQLSLSREFMDSLEFI